MKIVILERNSVGTDVSVDCIRDFGEVEVYGNTVTAQEIRERVRDADIVIANKAPLREETLKDAPGVKLICEFATGYDNCDLEYCKKRGIKVVNVRDYCTGMVSQHTFTLALALSQKLLHYDNYVKSGQYSAQDRFSNFDLPFYELEGKTWGIVGMGNIGRRVAGIAAAFGCRVIFHSVTGRSTCTEYLRVDKDTRGGKGTAGGEQPPEPHKGQQPPDYHAPSGMGQRGGKDALRGGGIPEYSRLPEGRGQESGKSLTETQECRRKREFANS